MLELQQLAKDWEARALLRDVNLRVDSGETVAILGPSGSGKSTLLKMVAGLESLDGGRVLFDAQDITALAPERRRFALMFQDFALFPHLDVQDNVAFGLVEQGLRKAAARAQACAMLERFGLQTFARARVTQLSGGEQQRVALARALTEFRQRIAEFNMATLLVTHDEAEARAMAQRGYRVLDGTLQLLW